MEKDKRIAELEAEVTQLKKEIERLKIVNEHYLEQLRLAQHRRFGASSEMTLPNQLSLFNEAEVIADAPEDDRITVHVRKKRKGKRKEFYEGLPTEQIVHELPEDERVCPDCGGTLHPAVMRFCAVKWRLERWNTFRLCTPAGIANRLPIPTRCQW